MLSEEDEAIMREKAELFDWLMTQMRGSVEVNTTTQVTAGPFWSLPLNVLTGISAKSPHEAIQLAWWRETTIRANSMSSALEAKPEALNAKEQ